MPADLPGDRRSLPPSNRRTIEGTLARAASAGAAQIELQFADVTGAVKTVAVPVRRLREVLETGEWFDGSAMEGSAREVESDMRLRPDASTFSIVDAAEGPTGRLICEVETAAGEPYRGDPRACLRSLVEAAAEAGFRYLVAPEIEFFLLPASPGGAPPGPPDDDASGYFEGARGRARRVALEIASALEGLGVRVESSHHEVAPGQFEIDLPLRGALAAADAIATLKPAVRELAAARGMAATFMPQPFADAPGSGMHTHQVLVGPDGRNAFYGAADPYCLSAAGRAFVAGQLEHAAGMCALLAPTINSYKRLVPGYEAPIAGTWGRHSRAALIRVPAAFDERAAEDPLHGPNVELRLPDPSCNPYVAFAAMLAAGLDGIDREVEPGPPVEELEHSYGSVRGHAVTPELPASLEAALERLEADDVVVAALGSELVGIFREAKSLEIAAYRRQVTPWEVATYFERS